jgi:hypothetical protein
LEIDTRAPPVGILYPWEGIDLSDSIFFVAQALSKGEVVELSLQRIHPTALKFTPQAFYFHIYAKP